MTSTADSTRDASHVENISREPGEIVSAYKLRHWSLLALLTAPVLLAGCSRTGKVDAAASAPVAAVVTVTRHDLSNTLEIASEFEPYQEIEVYAKVSGYIQKLYVDWGTHVKEGQPMADLEIPELEQQLQEDQATIHRRMRANWTALSEELNRANSAYKVAHLTYSRLADVQKSQPGLVAQEDIDVSEGKDTGSKRRCFRRQGCPRLGGTGARRHRKRRWIKTRRFTPILI